MNNQTAKKIHVLRSNVRLMLKSKNIDFCSMVHVKLLQSFYYIIFHSVETLSGELFFCE